MASPARQKLSLRVSTLLFAEKALTRTFPQSSMLSYIMIVKYKMIIWPISPCWRTAPDNASPQVVARHLLLSSSHGVSDGLHGCE